MKVIKRDGRAVDYDRSKIYIAIEKANKEVNIPNRASKEDIKGIIAYIEDLNKRRILVEDIQDIIEQKLMELKKYELAKRYIVYRYTRALIRRQNTTDETILGIIRNDNKEKYNNKPNMTVAEQRDLIAGEVSKDLTKRLLLPEKIATADEEGILYFHGKDYFVHPMINSSVINIADMLDNGTVINGNLVESPKSFLVACIVVTQIIGTLTSNQSGDLVIDMIHLGKYLRKSYDKYKQQIKEESNDKLLLEFMENSVNERVKEELKNGIQIIQYQLSTLESIIGREPRVTFLMHIEENDKYQKENEIIIKEALKQRLKGIKNIREDNDGPEYPRYIYIINELTEIDNGKFSELTKLAINCSIIRKSPNYIFLNNIKEETIIPIGNENNIIITGQREGNLNVKTGFNQGIVSLNLPQIAIIADNNEEKFWGLLEERLDLCYEALMCRHYSLVGIQNDISPLHWKYGAIARMEDGKKIDELLYGKNSTLGLGYLGIYEMTKLLKNVNVLDSEGIEFATRVIKHLKDTVKNWTNKTNIQFILYGINSKEVLKRFAKIDKEKYGTIENITDKEYYTNSYDVSENTTLFEKLSIERKFQKILSDDNNIYLEIKDKMNKNDLEEAFKYLSGSKVPNKEIT